MQYIAYWGPQRPGSGGPQPPSAGPGCNAPNIKLQVIITEKVETYQPAEKVGIPFCCSLPNDTVLSKS